MAQLLSLLEGHEVMRIRLFTHLQLYGLCQTLVAYQPFDLYVFCLKACGSWLRVKSRLVLYVLAACSLSFSVLSPRFVSTGLESAGQPCNRSHCQSRLGWHRFSGCDPSPWLWQASGRRMTTLTSLLMTCMLASMSCISRLHPGGVAPLLPPTMIPAKNPCIPLMS